MTVNLDPSRPVNLLFSRVSPSLAYGVNANGGARRSDVRTSVRAYDVVDESHRDHPILMNVIEPETAITLSPIKALKD